MPVVNLYRKPYDVYIGRPGKGQDGLFGNPVRVGSRCQYCGEKHETNQSVLNCYEHAYLRPRVDRDRQFRLAVKGLIRDGKEVVVGCFCDPKPCHGHPLLKVAWELQEE